MPRAKKGNGHRARSSAGEHSLHTGGVTGSIPVVPTMIRRRESGECRPISGERTDMLDTNNPALWYSLNRLMINYWAEVDDNGGAQAHEFYLPDALYAVGNNRFEGEDKIRAFYARRRQRGIASTRHLVGNLRFSRAAARRARMVGLMSLYRPDATPPFLGARPPAMIADFEA